MRDNANGLGFKLSMKRLARMGLMDGSHSCTMNLYIILSLKEEIGIFQKNSNNVVICHIDREVMFCSCVSCRNFL